jgi:hypothetical protein
MLALSGALLALTATAKYGISNHSDSARYFSVARSLAEGTGFRMYDGVPEVLSTPLYPVVLSAAAVLGIDLLTYARFLHATLFGLTILVAAALLYRLRLGAFAWWIGLLAVITSRALFDQATTALTDCLFILIASGWLWLLSRYFDAQTRSSLLLAAALAGLAWAARYVGVTTVLVGTLLVLAMPRARRPLARLGDAFIYGFVASLPGVAWMIRNQLVAGPMRLTPPKQTFLEYSRSIFEIIGTWIAPNWMTSEIRVALGVLAMILVLAMLGWSWKRSRESSESENRMRWYTVLTLSCWTLVYIAFVNLTLSITFATDYPDRYITPAVVPIVALLAVAIDEAIARWSASRRHLALVIRVAAVAMLLWPARLLAGRVQYAWMHGAGGYATDRWQRSVVAEYLRGSRPTSPFFTNEPNALYMLAGATTARWVPGYDLPGDPPTPDSALRSFRDSIPDARWRLLVLFDPLPPELSSYAYTPEQWARYFEVECVRALDDGTVFRVRRRDAASAGEGLVRYSACSGSGTPREPSPR